jgi:hypothetical protein
MRQAIMNNALAWSSTGTRKNKKHLKAPAQVQSSYVAAVTLSLLAISLSTRHENDTATSYILIQSYATHALAPD